MPNAQYRTAAATASARISFVCLLIGSDAGTATPGAASTDISPGAASVKAVEAISLGAKSVGASAACEASAVPGAGFAAPHLGQNFPVFPGSPQAGQCHSLRRPALWAKLSGISLLAANQAVPRPFRRPAPRTESPFIVRLSANFTQPISCGFLHPCCPSSPAFSISPLPQRFQKMLRFPENLNDLPPV